MIKKGETGPDYTVMPLEGLWWADNPANFTTGNKQAWQWNAMIMQPDFVTETQVENAMLKASRKKDLPALTIMRFEAYKEGQSAHIMYIGP